MNDDPRVEAGTYEQLQLWVEDPKWVHFVAHIQRPGVQGCMETLENTHYAPGTERNKLFELRMIKWEGLVYALISIPKEEREYMTRAAAANGLRIANGYPTMLSGDGKGNLKVEHFPARSDSVFTLENVPGHPVYMQSMDRLRAAAAGLKK